MAEINATPAVDKTSKSETIKALANSVAALEGVTKGLGEKLSELSKPAHAPHRTPGELFGIGSGDSLKDSRPYSFMNVVKALKEGTWDNAKQEYGVHLAMKKAGYACERGILTPSDPVALELYSPELKGIKSIVGLSDAASQPENLRFINKALSAYGTDAAGGALMDVTMANSVIELLRARVVVAKAGAQEMALPPGGQLSWARQTADPTWNWSGENTAISQSDPAFGNILFSAKKAAALVTLSNDSLLFTNPAIEVIVRMALAESGARFEDKAFLDGLGSSYQPQGIINTSGITAHTATTTGTNGDTFQPEDVANMIAKVEEANDNGATAFIMRPLMWAAIANRRADSVTAADGKGPFMFWTTRGDISQGIGATLNGVPVFTTTSVVNTRVKGSGTNLSYILTGNFKRAVIARTGAMEIAALSTGEEFKADQTVVRAISRLDFQLTHTKPFVLCDSLIVG